MAQTLVIVMIFLVATGIAAAQDSSCPKAYIEGPMANGEYGEPTLYSVRVEPASVSLAYLWTVTTSKGDVGMVRGQGTQTIYVPWSNEGVTVTVKVIGLPARCPDTASASAIYDPPPVAEKLAEFAGPLSKVLKTRFDAVLETAISNPTARLYILIGGKRGSVSQSKRSKRSALNSLLLNKLGRSGQKAVIVDSDRADDRVTIWLLPAGAEHPKP